MNQPIYRLTTLLVSSALLLASCGPKSNPDLTSTPQSSPDPKTPSAEPNPAPNSETAIELSFGVYSSDKPTEMIKQFRPTLDVLEAIVSEKLGKTLDIRMEVAATYETGINNLVDGKVDLSQLGPASYITAKKRNEGLSIVAIESKGGTKQFSGVFCVAEASPIQSVSDLKGKTFAFGSELSTIGRYLSQEYLMDNGVKASDLGRYEYLGRHDKVGAAVALRAYDAGVLKEGTFKKLVAGGTEIREIARFPNVTKPWVARVGLDESLQEVLRAALVQMEDSEALEALRVDGFLEGEDADYAPIRTSMDRNDAFFQ